MENYKTIDGLDCVIVTNADGSVWSGTKEAYDLSQVEHLTEIPTPDEA